MNGLASFSQWRSPVSCTSDNSSVAGSAASSAALKSEVPSDRVGWDCGMILA
jgi:hypothetical protein